MVHGMKALVGACALATCAPNALAQPGCRGSAGPDVVVGDIHSVANYPPSDGWDAIALGTTACNLGTVWANWIAETNEHPVFGGSLYRFSIVDGTGRFEQIGQSWLKHAFFAVSFNDCCNNCTETDGRHLGVGCSDSYTAMRNGNQQFLGPKWQVNAATGVFTYPPANPPWSGTIARRLRFALADVVTTGPGVDTRFFGEAQYLTADDAAAGNNLNNASYRELSVGGTETDRVIEAIDATNRLLPAIRAWQQVDPGVTLHEVDIPDDGRMIVGSRAFTLANGMYRYEYAVFNMNSDRSAGGFRVPLPASAPAFNIGFHDVHYSDGDGLPTDPSQPNTTARNFDGADWQGGKVGSSVIWQTTAHASDPNTNALRWGTTYNFRFDSPVAPLSAGRGAITLFKPGTPTTVAFTGAVPCAFDFNADGFVNGQDFDDYVIAFEAGDPGTDTDGDGFVTGLDFDAFVVGFEAGC